MPVLEDDKQITISQDITQGSAVNPIGENISVTPTSGYDAIKKITATVNIAPGYYKYVVHSDTFAADVKYCFISWYRPAQVDPTTDEFKQLVGEQTIIYSGGTLAGTSEPNRIRSCKVKDLVDGVYYTSWHIEMISAMPIARWKICLEIQGHAAYDTITFDGVGGISPIYVITPDLIIRS